MWRRRTRMVDFLKRTTGSLCGRQTGRCHLSSRGIIAPFIRLIGHVHTVGESIADTRQIEAFTGGIFARLVTDELWARWRCGYSREREDQMALEEMNSYADCNPFRLNTILCNHISCHRSARVWDRPLSRHMSKYNLLKTNVASMKQIEEKSVKSGCTYHSFSHRRSHFCSHKHRRRTVLVPSIDRRWSCLVHGTRV